MSNQTLKSRISSLPKSPGVYEFRDKKGKILYVGKATSLKDRAGSYFLKNAHLDRPHIESMIAEIADIRVWETDSVLEALILEANLIKKHQPKYNVLGKDDKSFVQVVITKEDFPRVLVVREKELKKYPISLPCRQASNIQYPKKSKTSNPKIPNTKYNIQYTKTFGPYTSKHQLDIALKLIRRIFPFHNAKQVTRQCCFDHQIGLCPGPHIGAISRVDYLKNIHGIEMILQGKKKKLLMELEKQMKEAAKKHEFEKAAQARNRIFALQHIRDVALISENNDQGTVNNKIRIEAYDISNISGDYAVGSMVVFSGNKPDKNEYRKFKIKTVSGIDDVAMMREVLRRRFKNNWQLPDLILADGGKGHVNMAEQVLKEFKLDIPVVGVAKGPTRKNLNIQYPISNKNIKSKIQKMTNIFDNKTLLANIMSEAHRFAIGYHKKLRRKNWKDK